jgi:hypothetical protein
MSHTVAGGGDLITTVLRASDQYANGDYRGKVICLGTKFAGLVQLAGTRFVIRGSPRLRRQLRG